MSQLSSLLLDDLGFFPAMTLQTKFLFMSYSYIYVLISA